MRPPRSLLLLALGAIALGAIALALVSPSTAAAPATIRFQDWRLAEEPAGPC